jgi:tRNA 2-thiouridine synthesizing protein A
MPESPLPPAPSPLPAPPPPRRVADLRGEKCPYTFIKARLAMEELAAGEILKVILDFRPAWTKVPASFLVLGHELVSSEDEAGGAKAFLFRCGADPGRIPR